MMDNMRPSNLLAGATDLVVASHFCVVDARESIVQWIELHLFNAGAPFLACDRTCGSQIRDRF